VDKFAIGHKIIILAKLNNFKVHIKPHAKVGHVLLWTLKKSGPLKRTDCYLRLFFRNSLFVCVCLKRFRVWEEKTTPVPMCDLEPDYDL